MIENAGTSVDFLASVDHAGLDQPFRFMDLPAEIRKRVYELLFFGSEEDDGPIQPAHEIGPQDPCRFVQPALEVVSMSRTASRQIHMHEQTEIVWFSGAEGPPSYRKPVYTSSRRFPLAIFRCNHAIQAESEPVFYGLASFNLMGPSQGRRRGWQCLSELPQRYRRLIRRVEHLCFDSNSASAGFRSLGPQTLLDWTLFFKILSNECPALQSLRLWVHSDQQESEWLAGARETDPWIQAVLQLQKLENLQYFDLPGIKPFDLRDAQYLPGNVHPQIAPSSYVFVRFRLLWLKFGNVLRPTEAEPSSTASILPWLQVRLLKTNRPTTPAVSQEESKMLINTTSVPILKLPLAIRARIYRHALLPVDKQVHPCIKSWYDETTQAVVPLLLTCRAVREEVEEVLYGYGVFTSVGESYINAAGPLLHFFKELPSRLRAKIRYVLMENYSDYINIDPIRYLERELCLEQLTLVLSSLQVRRLNNPNRYRGKIRRQQWPRITGRIRNVQLKAENKDGVDILPEVRKHFEVERREEWLKMESRRQSRRSAREVELREEWLKIESCPRSLRSGREVERREEGLKVEDRRQTLRSARKSLQTVMGK